MKMGKSIWPYIKGYKFKSLLVRNFLYVFMLIALPLVLVLSLNYKKFSKVVNTQVIDMNEELLQKSAVVTDNIMQGVLDILDRMVQLDEVVEIVQIERTDADYYQKAGKTIEKIKENTLANTYIKSATIYSDVNDMLINNEGTVHIGWVADKEKWYSIHKLLPMEGSYVLVNHANSIFVCQPIRGPGRSLVGLFVLEVDLQRIGSLLESQQIVRQGIFFVTDISGQIMYCNDPGYATWTEETSREYRNDIARVRSGESQFLEDRGKRIISTMGSIHQSWRYAFVTEMPYYEEETQAVSDFLFTSVMVGVLASIVAAYFITYLTYRPMKKIMSVIENPQLHWSEREASKESNELLYITSNILANRNENKEISEELEERVRALRQAQFRALQFQIDPHFLYNTLETIKWRAVEDMGLGNKTSKMLTKVASLYRLGLENDDTIVPLREELDFLKLYIEILQIRFGDSILFHWDIDEELYDCNIIKMCLQPIVENAIQHGLRPRNYQGHITISAYREHDCLCISVENDGQDMDQSKIRDLNTKLRTGDGFETNKVGLRNVNERIKLIYGKKYGVSVSCTEPDDQSAEGQIARTRVTLTFPCRKIYGSEEIK